jgi:PTS system nitrogen regulatory IIA component
MGQYGSLPSLARRLALPQSGSAMAHEDFDIDSLAAYLHLTPQQVMKLADRGKIPGRKVAGQWRFSQAEIHHWVEHRIGLSDEEELIEVEGVLEQSAGATPADIVIASLLLPEAIAIPLEARTRNSVINRMVDLAAGTGLLWDPEKMAEAVRAREDLYPTALDNGVALMHPRRPMSGILCQAFLALGCTSSGIPFGRGRGGMTDVFFLICSVDDSGHLRTLARLSRVIGSPGFLDALRAAPDAGAAHALIAETENSLLK